MIAHVAAAGEQSGRVVLWVSSGVAVHQTPISAACAVALVFQAELESLIVADIEIERAASFSFARYVPFRNPLAGMDDHTVDPAFVMPQAKLIDSASARMIVRAARKAGVPLSESRVEGDPVEMIAAACASKGPWNIVVIAEAANAAAARRIDSLLKRRIETTGVVVAGDGKWRQDGPVIAAIEDVDCLASIMRAAERVSHAFHNDIRIVILSETADEGQWLETQARLIADATSNIRFERVEPTGGRSDAALAKLSSLHPSFVIARFGGAAAPADERLARHLSVSGAAYLMIGAPSHETPLITHV